jgi:4-amino-4-deoxy-L-arabinose transferase-like glycosyltransferase
LILSALFVVALAVRVAVAWQQEWPGYIDATYYTIIARNLVEGRGFTESVLWNYVDRPIALPHPSNAHWMPFTSLVAAPSLWLFGDGYRAAQAPFVLIAAALVPLTYAMSMRLFGRRRWALLSAALMLGGGTYFPHWTSIDAWSIYPLIGTAVLGLGVAATIATTARRALVLALFAGLVVGLGHLTRADGLLLFIPLAVLLLRGPARAALVASAALGWATIMVPWMARNVRVFGRPLLGGHLVWLQDYVDLFAYEKDVGSVPWSAADWVGRLGEGFRSLFMNGVSLAGAMQFVFLPLLLVALWTERRRPIVQACAAFLAGLWLTMSFVFTLPGPRSSFLHSLTAVIPLLFALAPVGLSRVIGWVAARRPHWHPPAAERFFSVVLFAIGSILSAHAYVSTIGWYRTPASYGAIGALLAEREETPATPLVCVDAPACHYWTGRPAIAIPADGDRALCRAASRYGARYLILEDNHPRFLDRLYAEPDGNPRFEHLGTWRDTEGRPVQLLRIVTSSAEAC